MPIAYQKSIQFNFLMIFKEFTLVSERLGLMLGIYIVDDWDLPSFKLKLILERERGWG